ncbi:PREDICTED: THAP domain-containing protein 2-like [Vollenhovia emeryi]|uniref:THAP domain-containing protein 2-like n=1 Tax=Vollenhovia emeryi TaxID=411798 RepID=UPI0005F4F35B|nr:PREDICTED: THAP domain-containing protein 2-like [Vollenhovia emeryi]
MTGCTAPGCTNSDKKGFVMKIFPRDPTRRAQWAANVGREGWTPTDRSFLCEVHFSYDMWENKRTDGKRKLKGNAVPTIFGSEAKMIKSYHENIHASFNDDVDCVTNDLSVQSEKAQNEKESNDCNDKDELQLESAERKTYDSKLKNILRTIKKQKQIICGQARIIKNQNVKLAKYKKCVLITRRDFKALKLKKQQNINSALLSKLQEIFTNDQITALKNNRRVQKWTNETIMKALRLRFACGITGYEELRRQKFPLPGLRTLRRKVENFKFKSGISDDIFKFLKLKVSNWNEIDKECCLVFDEISISSGNIFDNSSESYIGNVTLPGHTEPNQLVSP